MNNTFDASGSRDAAATSQLLADQFAAAVGTFRRINERAAEAFHPELTQTAFHLARWLATNGPARQSELAEALDLERSNVSGTVGQLRKLDFVVSERDPNNLGAVIVSITDLGRSHVESAAEVRAQAFAERISGWAGSDIAKLSELLARFSDLGPGDIGAASQRHVTRA